MRYRKRPSGQEKSRRPQPKPLGGALHNAVKSLGISRNYGWLVVTKWPNIVGEQIARRSRAFRYDDGRLFIAVPDAPWRQELALQTDHLLKKIHTLPFGHVVKELRFVQGEKG